MRIITLMGLVMALALSACSSTEMSGQPEINYGRDVCVHCGMIVSEAKFAAAYRLGGEEFIFDDIGDLVVYARENDIDLDASQTWVHDYETEESLLVANAHFVPTVSVATPMGHGVIAFTDKIRAERFAAELGGQVIDWNTLTSMSIDNGRVGIRGDDGSGMDMGSSGMDMGSSGSMSGDG